jgi:hypothetical protein
MSATAIPFQLDAGLTLESPEVILPWDRDADELAGTGAPEVVRVSSVTFVTWSGSSVFAGIEADVTFRSDTKNVFWLQPRYAQKFSSIAESYNHVLSQLVERLGEPHISEVTYDGYPWSKWHYGDIRISLRIAERFTEYLSLMVSKGVE